MKKLLLSLVVLLTGFAAANATQYTIYSSENRNDWKFTGDKNGYNASLNIDGKTFVITTAKDKSTSNLVSPSTEIRVYKNSTIKIACNDWQFKNVVITATATDYGKAQSIVETGWTQNWDANELTLTMSSTELANEVTMKATANQFRIVKIVVSDTEIEAEPEPEAVVVTNVKEAIAQKTNTRVTVDFDLTVGFVNNSNIFAVDAAGDFIQVYGSNSYKVGDVIPAGWDANYILYNGNTPELEPKAALPAATEGTFEPKEVAATDISNALVNNVVVVKNVEFAAETPATKTNFTGKVGETTLDFRNNYTKPSVAAGLYDVKIVVTIYSNKPSLYVIEYTPVDPSAIEGIDSDNANAPVEYYNLQGIRVNNPENGIFIRRQGTDVKKVYVK